MDRKFQIVRAAVAKAAPMRLPMVNAPKVRVTAVTGRSKCWAISGAKIPIGASIADITK